MFAQRLSEEHAEELGETARSPRNANQPKLEPIPQPIEPAAAYVSLPGYRLNQRL